MSLDSLQIIKYIKFECNLTFSVQLEMINIVFFQLWEDKEGKKKMNKNNAKALSTLRQKIRKYNRDYETEIAAYKEVSQDTLTYFFCTLKLTDT